MSQRRVLVGKSCGLLAECLRVAGDMAKGRRLTIKELLENSGLLDTSLEHCESGCVREDWKRERERWWWQVF
jgi:hypothetical protein